MPISPSTLQKFIESTVGSLWDSDPSTLRKIVKGSCKGSTNLRAVEAVNDLVILTLGESKNAPLVASTKHCTLSVGEKKQNLDVALVMKRKHLKSVPSGFFTHFLWVPKQPT